MTKISEKFNEDIKNYMTDKLYLTNQGKIIEVWAKKPQEDYKLIFTGDFSDVVNLFIWRGLGYLNGFYKKYTYRALSYDEKLTQIIGIEFDLEDL